MEGRRVWWRETGRKMWKMNRESRGKLRAQKGRGRRKGRNLTRSLMEAGGNRG